jgi:hypothetical protein
MVPGFRFNMVVPKSKSAPIAVRGADACLWRRVIENDGDRPQSY